MPLPLSPRTRCLVALFVGLTSLAAQAQVTPDVDLTLKDQPKQFVRDEWRIWSSPFRRKSCSAKAFLEYVVPFVVVTGGLIAADRPLKGALPNSDDQLRWSGRVSQIGSTGGSIGIAAGTYLIGRFSGDNHLQETGLLSLEALGHAGIAVFVFKELANRERPLDHDQRGGFWEGGTSFPSGHSAAAFSIATVFAYEYHDHIAIPIAAYSLASLVAASRVGAERHWISDAVAGGSLGFLMGRFTYKRRHENPHAGAVPAVTFSRGVPALAWTF